MFRINKISQSLLLVSSTLLLGACGSSSDTVSTDSVNNSSAVISVVDGQGNALPNAYVTLYSDYGRTIEKTVTTDDKGQVDFGVLNRQLMSFSVVALSEEEEVFKAYAIYDAPARSQEVELYLNASFADSPFCLNTTNMTLKLEDAVSLNWAHQLYIDGERVDDVEIKDGAVLELCDRWTNDNKLNAFLVSTNPEDNSEKRYSYALGEAPVANASLSLAFGSAGVPLEVSSEIELSFFGSYFAQLAGSDPLYFHGLGTDNENLTSLVPANIPGTNLALSVGSDLQSNEHYVVHYFTQVPTALSLVPTLNHEPVLSLDENNELAWQVEGTQPSLVTAFYEDDFEQGYRMSWEINAPGSMKTISVPALPEALKQFEHNAERQYFDIYLQMNHSLDYSSFGEMSELTSDWLSSDPAAKSYSEETRVAYLNL